MINIFYMVRTARFVRPAFDWTVLGLGICVAVHLQDITWQNTIQKPQQKQIAQLLATSSKKSPTTEKAKTFHTVYASEQAMWQAFEQWAHVEPTSSGTCYFNTSNKSEEKPFSLQCIGLNASNFIRAPISEPLDMPTVLVPTNTRELNNNPETKTQKEKPEKTERPPADLPVQGWFNTRQGRRYFDASKKRWVNEKD